MTKTKSASSAAKSVFIGGVTAKAIAFIGSVILARLLVPEDYGYWVIVTMITSFFSLVVDAGFEYYYIVNVNINQGEETPGNEIREIENSIFFLRLIVNFLLFCLQFGFSFLPISLLSSPIDDIIRVLSFIHVINVMGRINEVRLKKCFDFKKTTVINIVSEVLSTVVKVSCAVAGIGVMSFAWGSITKVLFNNIGLVSVGQFRPQLKIVSKKRVKDVFKFSTYMWLTQVGQYFSEQLDKFFLKSNYSLEQIGYYNFSNGTSLLFINYVLMPQSSVVMNYISNNKLFPSVLEQMIAKILNIVILFVIPVQISLYFFSYEFIEFVYGVKWLPALPVFRVFLIYTLINVLFFPFQVILTALGEVKSNSKLIYVRIVLVFLILSVLTSITSNLVFYAIGFTVALILFYFFKSYISIKKANLNIKNIYRKIRCNFLIMILSGLFLFILDEFLQVTSLISKLICFFCYVLLFILINYLFNRKTVQELFEYVMKR